LAPLFLLEEWILKGKFTSVDATQVTLDKEVDFMTKDGNRICSAHLFLTDLI